MGNDNLASGFSSNPFMVGYDNRIFEEDETLGFRFPGGRLISSKGFVLLEEIIRGVRTGYPTFLNMGDSSTSGWDSNRIFKGNQDPNAPFFGYKTYPTLLEEQLFAHVFNGGVPGYTSYQGKKYLELLLKKLSRSGVTVDYVTIYFGNNDCTYNQYEDKVRLDAKIPSESSRGERVTVEDYKRNIKCMIETCCEYGVKPILIVPPVHYDWEPGVRSDKYREESLEILGNLGDSQLAQELERACVLFEQSKFQQSSEADRVLPRLKLAYRKALLQAARETRTDLIDVQRQIPLTDNKEYFADYCHPLETVNQMIVDKIKKIRDRDLFHKPLKRRIREFFKRRVHSKSPNQPPTDIYTLY
ncbi:hypothetical protein HYY69_03130 [Candidatus Woesearchaeota archaeon]|nr:hypothetical protein [Candidatus Woesearchaeota archaeon]